MGPPTDPGSSGSARVSKWLVRPPGGHCLVVNITATNSKAVVILADTDNRCEEIVLHFFN
ncbi:unnamed protein product, partial [Staurois parvus]